MNKLCEGVFYAVPVLQLSCRFPRNLAAACISLNFVFAQFFSCRGCICTKPLGAEVSLANPSTLGPQLFIARGLWKTSVQQQCNCNQSHITLKQRKLFNLLIFNFHVPPFTLTLKKSKRSWSSLLVDTARVSCRLRRPRLLLESEDGPVDRGGRWTWW